MVSSISSLYLPYIMFGKRLITHYYIMSKCELVGEASNAAFANLTLFHFRYLTTWIVLNVRKKLKLFKGGSKN